MRFQYKSLSYSKYRDINTLRWFQPISQCQKVKQQALQEVWGKKPVKRSREELTDENQQYLKRRLKTEYSV